MVYTLPASAFRLPGCCVLCGAAASDGLCADCHADLHPGTPRCVRCGLPVTRHLLCGACLSSPPPLDRVLVGAAYAWPVSDLLVAGKFHARLENLAVLGTVLARRVEQALGAVPDAILPVPLSTRRLHERGYNQSHEIARVVARQTGIPIDDRVVRRTRHTGQQAELARAARRRNVRGCFAVDASRGLRHVALVDDVMTTGATLGELALTLKRAGVARVDAWVATRATP